MFACYCRIYFSATEAPEVDDQDVLEAQSGNGLHGSALPCESFCEMLLVSIVSADRAITVK
jgi:hypothetical protein